MLRERCPVPQNTRELKALRQHWHNVISHLSVLHSPILPDHFFIQCITDPLRDATCDLTSCQHGMKDFTDFLKSNKVIDRSRYKLVKSTETSAMYTAHAQRRIGFAAIFLIIPENAGRRFIVRPRLEFSVFGNVFRAGYEKLVLANIYLARRSKPINVC